MDQGEEVTLRGGRGWVPLVSILVGVVGAAVLLLGPTLPGSASASVTTAAVSSGTSSNCAVKLVYDESNLKAQATILSGCTGSHFYLVSWEARSDIYKKAFPQTLFDWTQGGSWTVQLPPCYWQVDFSWWSAPPGTPSAKHHYLAGRLGGVACQANHTTASTSTTSTTLVTTTTTTKPCGQVSLGISAAADASTVCTTTTTTPRKGTTTTSSTVPGGSTTSTLPVSTTSGKSQSGGGTTTTPPATSSTPASSSPSALAFTGFPAMIVVIIALALLACGFILVQASRQRSVGRSRNQG